MNTEKTEYPEHEKLLKVKDEIETISGFLEWIGEKNLEICFIGDDDRGILERIPIQQTKGALIGEYFGIDDAQIEKEKREMIESIRRDNA